MWRALGIILGGAVLVAGGAAVAQAVVDTRRATALTVQQALAANTRIPFRVRRWAQQVALSAVELVPRGWEPLAWAKLVLAVMDRESQGGELLTPKGPGGTGDPSARALSRVPVQLKSQVVPISRATDGTVFVVPPDGGWGRGLLQIDWMSHDFARTGPWADPNANVAYGMRLLSNLYEAWAARPDSVRRGIDPLTCALASYNAGLPAVQWAIGKGRHPDSVTTGDDYSADVIRRLGEWVEAGPLPPRQPTRQLVG